MAQIFIFGDSIAYGHYDKESGWTARLRKFLDAFEPDLHNVYSLGVPVDESTKEVLKRFGSETQARQGSKKENFIIFAIGANDTQFINSKNSTRTSLEEFRKNICKLIDMAQKFSSKILFVGLTPVDESKVNPIPWAKDKSHKNKHVSMFNDAIRSICAENNIYFIDLFEKLAKTEYKNLIEDGVHPNSNGHRKIFEIIKQFLLKNKLL